MEKVDTFIHKFKKLFEKKDHDQVNRYYIPNLSLRIFSTIIDFCVIFFPIYFVLLSILPLDPLFEGATFLKSFNFFTYISIFLIYGLIIVSLWYYFNSATIGKKLLKLKIVDFESKQELSFERLCLRYLSYVIYFIPILILASIIISYFRQDKRTLHDILTSTQVISTDTNYVD